MANSPRNTASNTASNTAPSAPEQNGTHLMDEPDIGSGDKTPAERETDEQIRQIPARPAPGGDKPSGQPGPNPG